MNKKEIIENCLTLFEKKACKQTYDMKGGVTAVVEYLLNQGQSLPIDSVSDSVDTGIDFSYRDENGENTT